MKILVISDTHGRHQNFDRVIEKTEPVDLLLHLGDSEDCDDYIEAVAGCPVEMIAGNCDRSIHLRREKVLQIDGYTVFMTHGHAYHVKRGVEWILEAGKQRGADIILFGHTHEPFLMKEDGIWLVNPGSLSFPRPFRNKPSYVLMETGDGEEVKITLHSI